MQGMNWNELSKSNNFGYQLGVMAQVPLGPVYLQPEIFYSSARFKLQGDLLNPDGTMAGERCFGQILGQYRTAPGTGRHQTAVPARIRRSVVQAC